MELDVFSDNVIANGWYASLGFEPTSGSRWWCATDLPASEAFAATATGVPAADAVHERYGFSEIGVHSGEHHYRVGRLGEGWYRLNNPGILADERAMGALHALHSRRGFLLIADERVEPGSRWTHIASARRMTIPLSLLRKQLHAHAAAS
jgi:hypothetical protein